MRVLTHQSHPGLTKGLAPQKFPLLAKGADDVRLRAVSANEIWFETPFGWKRVVQVPGVPACPRGEADWQLACLPPSQTACIITGSSGGLQSARFPPHLIPRCSDYCAVLGQDGFQDCIIWGEMGGFFGAGQL